MKRYTLLIFVLLLFSFCGPQQEKVDRYLENGVEIIANHSEPYNIRGEPSNLYLEKDFIIDLEREDLIKDPRFDSHQKRVDNSELIISTLDEVLATRTLAEWAEQFEIYDLIWEPETAISEAIDDPQVAENDFIAEVEHSSGTLFKLLRVPFQFSETPINPRSAAPELSQHTEEVLLEMGYDWTDISQLKEQKVIL